MAENMFDGFDHTQYKEEVEERWGKDAYAKSDAWWRSMSAEEKAAWQAARRAARQRLDRGARAGHRPGQRRGAGARAAPLRVAARHPGHSRRRREGPTKEYFLGLGEMYVADERFGANYGGQAGAEFVRDAMTVYAERNL